MPVRLPFSVGEPLAGESWPFQCVSDDKIIKKGRIFLPDLVFFIGYHNSADVFFVHDEVPATRLSRWCSSGSCRVAHRIPSARRVGQLSASKRDMARKERSTLLCQKWGTETRNDELSQGRNVALDLQPLSSRFSYSVTLPSILISHHVSTTGGIGGNGRWAHSHHCVGSRFMISRGLCVHYSQYSQQCGLSNSDCKKLMEHGYYTVESVAFTTKKTLQMVKGISDPKTDKIISEGKTKFS